MADILTAIGFVSTGLHFMGGVVSDYRFASLEQARNNPYDRSYAVADTKLITDLVQPGQYIVSHLAGNDETESLCRDFIKLLPVREMRETFVSHMRFHADTERRTSRKKEWMALPDGPERTVLALQDFGSVHVEMCKAVLGWHGRDGVLAIRFDDIWGDNGRERQFDTIMATAAHAGIATINDQDIEGIIQQSLQRPNMTWSGKRTSLSNWWSEEAENMFTSFGGRDLNQMLGYGDFSW